MRLILKLAIAACWAACITFLVLVLSGTFSSSPAVLCARAQVLTERNRLAAAEKALLRAVEIEPGRAGAHLQLSQVRLLAGSAEAALASLHAALAADPTIVNSAEFKTYVALAADLERRRHFLQSHRELASLTPAGQLGPVQAAAWDLSGRVAFRESTGAAQPVLDELAKLAGSEVSAAVAAARACRWDDAAVIVRRMRPETTSVTQRLFERIESARAAAAEARSMFEAALEIEPSLAASKLGLAAMDARTGRRDEALRRVLEVLAATPDPPPGLPLLAAQMLARDGRINEAGGYVDQALARDPGNIPARYLRAAVLLCRKRFAELQPMLDQLRADNPSDSRLMFIQGTIDLLRGRYPEALDSFSTASAEHRGWDLLDYHRSLAEFRSGKPAAAAQTLRELCTRGEPFAEVRLALAAAELQTGRYADADADCERLLDADPGDADAIRLRAAARVLTRREPLEALEAFAKSRPRSPLAGQALAAAQMALLPGGAGKALADIDSVPITADTAAVHDRWRSRARITALAHSLAGRPDKAEEAYLAAAWDCPAGPEPLLYHARRLALEGRLCEAIAPYGRWLGDLNAIAGLYCQAAEAPATDTRNWREMTFAINTYFCLSTGGAVRTAAEILEADPFSSQSFDLLAMVYSAGLAGQPLREALGRFALGRLGAASALGRAVDQRRAAAAADFLACMMDADTLVPRLTEAYAKHFEWQ